MRSAIRIAACSLSLLLFFPIVTLAQDPAPAPKKEGPPPCPQVAVNGPGQRIFRDGERLTFAAIVTGGDPAASANFLWTTSAGVIETGQGTRTITVDTSGAGNDRQVGVDLWVGGYAPECLLQARASIKIVPPALKAFEFSELPPEQESEQLATFIPGIQHLTDNIYVLGYAGKTNVRGFANVVLKRIKAQMLASGIAYERLAFIDAGYRDLPAFEIWIVPVGADAPRPKPTLSAKDIVFPKTTTSNPAKRP
jgi:hypothetical protein